ncbi:MAG: PEP-CTERM sorting domain-containing protein [Pirellulaceae bacterium]|nr:PEP-CTERM sorting domain-containing protein [Planctomycetales bacterium]
MRMQIRLALASVVLACLAGYAGAQTVSINFGADEPNGAGSTVDGVAGAIGTANWNNVTGASGSATNLIDANGVATGVSVEWSSPNTWSSAGRGEENNTATGEDFDLMTGYVDTGGLGGQGVVINVAGLNSAISDPAYDVIVYINGGVNGRGGDYEIGGVTQSLTGQLPFEGTYTEGEDYVRFRNLTGDAFTLNTIPNDGTPARAPVNGIEIIGVPEPSSIALIFGGLLSLGMIRRKR